MSEKINFRKMLFGFLIGLLGAGMLLSILGLLSCSKYDDEHLKQLECGDSIVNYNFTGAPLMIEIMDPVTWIPCSSVWTMEKDNKKQKFAPYDGSYDNCLLGKKFRASVMIDPVIPGTQGEWVLLRYGILEVTNVFELK